jgi:hypothetical protein
MSDLGTGMVSDDQQALMSLITRLPKVELHMHIEGALEPELMFVIAARNAVALKYASVEAVREAYHFSNLQSFLDIYYEACSVLLMNRTFMISPWRICSVPMPNMSSTPKSSSIHKPIPNAGSHLRR